MLRTRILPYLFINLKMKTNSTQATKSLENSIEYFCLKTDKWLSELDFISNEIRFFKKVVQNYLKKIDGELKEKIDLVKKGIIAIEQKKQLLNSDLVKYREVLDRPKDLAVIDEKKLEEQLSNLQSKFNELNRDVREL